MSQEHELGDNENKFRPPTINSISKFKRVSS